MYRFAFSLALALVLVLGLAACGNGDGMTPGGADADPNAPDADPNAPDADPNAPDASPGQYSTLITATWTRPPGDEDYRCARLTVTEDTYITAFRPLDPPGTHHAVVSLRDTPNAADGEYDCSVGDLEHSMLFASGVGTDDLQFPAGVAIKVTAGQQLHLNLHTYNTTDSPITATSGVQVKTIPVAQVQQEAEVVFGGTTTIFLQNNQNTQTVSGGCTFDQDATLLSIWPHMHQLGTHMKVVHQATGGDVTLHDEPFDFNEQLNYSITPTLVQAGEGIRVTCSYVNTSGGTVIFGDSSDQEMCFAGLYRYPATGAGLFSCSSGITP
ncbi:MAG TPA: hypothetical protein VML75_22375 [Kofleriaceae bacterium]|nr:hypothetical protein [Kofleriaceae bacterium]